MLAKPYVAGGTDGGTIDLDSDNLPPLVHPRHLGTVPRLLGTYVREEGLLTWEEAIRKLSGLPAEILGLEERGTLAEGHFADLAVFDPEEIRGVATFEDPFHYSVGMRYVLVNGPRWWTRGSTPARFPAGRCAALRTQASSRGRSRGSAVAGGLVALRAAVPI